MDSLWNQILAEIQVEVSQPKFIAFFKPTKLLSVEEGVATIGSPNGMSAGLLEQNYYSLIKKLLDKKLDKNVSVVFTVTKSAVDEKEAGPLLAEKPL